MGLLHSLVSHAAGGVTGMQTIQRDWSPFLVHFTKSAAMKPLHGLVEQGAKPETLKKALDAADRESYRVVQSIVADYKLVARGQGGGPARICFSECTLPGVLSHAERYGRFGFAFRKTELFKLGGRPCVYMSRHHHAEVKALAQEFGAKDPDPALRLLSNILTPAGLGTVQDFTHEREWRIFKDVSLWDLRPEFIVAPAAFVEDLRNLIPRVGVVMPIDLLFEWGA